MVKQLVQDLSAKNIKLKISCGELIYEGPKSSITKEILQSLRDNKSSLLEYLKRNKTVPPSIPGLIMKPYGESLFYFPDPNRNQ